MPWWAMLIIILFCAVAVIIVLLLIIKFNKKLDLEGSVGDKGGRLKIENDTPINQQNSTQEKCANALLDIQFDFIKNYVISMIDSHMLVTTTFHVILNRYDINDKIYLKLLKKQNADIKPFNVCVNTIVQLYKDYALKIKEEIEKELPKIKDNIDNIELVSQSIDTICKFFEDDIFITSTITDFKTRGFKTELITGESVSIPSEQLDTKILQLFKTRLKKNSVELVSEIKLSKTRLLSLENKVIRTLSVMYCVNSLFDAIDKHLFEIYFESKPAILGDSEGV